MRERDLEALLVKEIRKRDGLAFKWVSPSRAGVPDRIVILPHDTVIFVELKTDGGKVSALQQITLDEIRARGVMAAVVVGESGLLAFLDLCDSILTLKRGALQ